MYSWAGAGMLVAWVAVFLFCVWAFAAPAHAQQVTPRAGTTTTVATGGTAVTAMSGPSNGCYIVNPLTATDQGLGSVEPLYIDPTTTATTTGSTTNTAIAPGQTWFCVPYSTLPVSVNAASSGHAFVVVRW